MNFPNVGDKENTSHLGGQLGPPGMGRGIRRNFSTAALLQRAMQRSMTLPPARMAESLDLSTTSSSDSDFNPVARITGQAAARHQRQKRRRKRQQKAAAAPLKVTLSKSSLDSGGSEQPLLSEAALTSAFQKVIRWTCLDFSTPGRRTLSLTVAFVLGILVPAIRHFVSYCPTCPDGTTLKFQTLVLILEGSLFSVSYLFAWVLLSRRSNFEILFLESLETESDEFRTNYGMQIKKSFGVILFWLLIPPAVTHTIGKVMWYNKADFSFLERLLPAAIPERGLIVRALLFTMTSVSWMYQTVVFLVICCIFWLLCNLHVLKLLQFSELLRSGETEMAVWILEHRRLRMGLREISHRFRAFLVLTAGIILFGTWSSLYSVLHSKEADLLTAGDISVCNFVHLMGGGLCLRAAAKITHRAQSIVGLASQMQATLSSVELGLSLRRGKSSIRLQGLSPSATAVSFTRPGSPPGPKLSNLRSFGPGPLGMLAYNPQRDEEDSSDDESEHEVQEPVAGLDIESGLDNQISEWADDSVRSTLWGAEESTRKPLERGGRKRSGVQERKAVRMMEPENAKWTDERDKWTDEEKGGGGGAGFFSGDESSARGGDDVSKRVIAVEAWCQRQALVAYLHHTRTGISVYGFVLDRAFVYSSLGLLCTSTFFVITRSLGA